MKIIMLKGLIGSGKSFWAKSEQTKDPSIVRVNKDELREMLHNGVWNKKNEDQVIRVEIAIIEEALSQGRTVIVDNTHGHPSHKERLDKIAKKFSTVVDVKEFNTPLSVCIERDSKREKPIGKSAIIKMYNQFFRKDSKPLDPIVYSDNLPYGVIVDIDGSLATMRNRGPFEWEKVGNDLPNTSVIALVQALYDVGHRIVVFSGRDSSCRLQTTEWLKEHSIPYHELHMRLEGSMDKDSIIKQELFNEHIKDKMNVIGVIDDRKQVKRMWVELGLTVFDVNQKDEEF